MYCIIYDYSLSKLTPSILCLPQTNIYVCIQHALTILSLNTFFTSLYDSYIQAFFKNQAVFIKVVH